MKHLRKLRIYYNIFLVTKIIKLLKMKPNNELLSISTKEQIDYTLFLIEKYNERYDEKISGVEL